VTTLLDPAIRCSPTVGSTLPALALHSASHCDRQDGAVATAQAGRSTRQYRPHALQGRPTKKGLGSSRAGRASPCCRASSSTSSIVASAVNGAGIGTGDASWGPRQFGLRRNVVRLAVPSPKSRRNTWASYLA